MLNKTNLSSLIHPFSLLLLSIFFNKHTIFHYNKLKLQQKDISTKTLHKAEI